MATKKISPKNPEARAKASAEDKTAERKTASMRGYRKTARKTSGHRMV
jgi:hypothetical protein